MTGKAAKQYGLWGGAALGVSVVWCELWSILFMFLAFGKLSFAFLNAPLYLWYYNNNPIVLEKLGTAAFLAAAGIVLLILFYIANRSGRPLHGAARFARLPEIKKANLLAEKGLLVGKWNGRYLCLGGATSACVGAPTGSGKGVGVVIPNLLNWPDSVVVLDIKKENYEAAAGFRAEAGQSVFMFDPGEPDGKTHRWNPLGYVSDQHSQRISDLQRMASLIWPDVPGGDPMWTASSRSLFLGIALYVAETQDLPFNLGEVYRQIAAGEEGTLREDVVERQQGPHALSQTCVLALLDYLNTNDKTRQSIRKTFTASLELWANPMVCAATETNDFDLRELRRERMSIFVGVAPSDLGRLRPLLNLFFQQVVDLNTRTLPKQDSTLRHQCLLLIDEFPALGRMYSIAQAVAYIRGYGLRMISIFQSDGQLRDKGLYGQEMTDSFLENHAVRVYFPPKDNRIAKEISESLGNYTTQSKTVSKQKPSILDKPDHRRNVSESEHSRELMKPQEVREMGDDKAILLVESAKPVYADKIRFFADKNFTDRLRNPPEVPALAVPQPTPTVVAGETVPRSMNESERQDPTALALNQFTLDFENIEVGNAAQASDAEVEAWAGQFMDRAST